MSLRSTVKTTLDNARRKAAQLNRFATRDEHTPSGVFAKPLSGRALAQLMGMDYERFSHLLPYRYVDEDDQLFINSESLGFALEVAPLSGANEEVIVALAEMIKNKLDHTVCMQVMLVGGNKISPLLDGLLSGYCHADPTFHALGLSQYQYLAHAARHGFHNKRDLSLPLRDYRCFIFVNKRGGYTKAHAARLCDLRDEVMTECKNAGLSNRNMSASALIQLVKSLINFQPNDIRPAKVSLDRYKELHEQAVDPSFSLTVFPHHLTTQVEGSEPTDIVALSLKTLPDELALWAQADHVANIFKPALGIPCPFVISVHFKGEPLEKSKLKAFRKATSYEKKANSPYAKLIPGTVAAAADWKTIREDLATDSLKLCKAYYSCVLFTDSAHRREHVSQTLAAFRVNGLDLYRIRYQQLQSYLALLPFVVEQGLWNDLSLLGRLNTLTTWNLTNLLPLVVDHKGAHSGHGVLAPTFRHQAACIDIFHPTLDNYNVCVTATSGSGKSVLSQSLISSVLADGGKVWVIDLGQSYKKFCDTLGGTYLDASTLRLNPFSGVTDIARVAESLRDLIAVMASPNEGLSDVQKAHLLDAVTGAFEQKQQQATIDDVIGALASREHNAPDVRIHDIATLLKKFSPTEAPAGSLAARIFNDASDFTTTDPLRERFVVLELGELENQPDPIKVGVICVNSHD